jgi:hypothetical protein
MISWSTGVSSRLVAAGAGVAGVVVVVVTLYKNESFD